MADGTSIWKKEIHLRKRSEPAALTQATATADAKRSIWKRDLHLGRKKTSVESVAPEPRQAIFEQPPLWDSQPPDPPFAAREVLSPDPQESDPVEPDSAVGAPSPETPSSSTGPEGLLEASRRLPTWGATAVEAVPAAPDAEPTAEPDWAAEGEAAPLDLYEAPPEADAEGHYGRTETADKPWEVMPSSAPTTGWPRPDEELEPAGAPGPISPAPPEPDARVAADARFALTPDAVERPESDPPTAAWWDSASVEAATLGADEAEGAVASEPGPVRAPTEPTRWSKPASPAWRTAETELPAADRELEIDVLPPAPAEQVESAGPVGYWTPETAPPESKAAASVQEPELEWSTPTQAEPLLPVSGWEHALLPPEGPASTELENPVRDAEPLARTGVSGPEGTKPSLFKRELRLPRPLRRGQKPSSVKASDAHPIKNIVGLRVGSSQLAAAYVHNNGAAELVQIARTPLARGIVTGGEVRDPEALTGALKKFFSENKLPRRGIRLGIASNRIGVRMLEVPKLDDPRLFENSIRFHAQETLPIPVSDAIIDHVVLGDGAGEGLEPTVRILLVFAHRELVDRHVQACRRAGLKLEGIDFEAFALLRALAAPRRAEIEPTRAVVAVAIGQERTIFAVSDGRICDFTRVLEWGGGSLDVSIARALNLTPSQAEPLKLALSLDGDAAPSQLTPEQAETARAAIRTELQSLSRELVSSLQFYQARAGSLDIGEIMLSGGGAQLPGLAAELERLVGVPVVTGDPFARVEVSRKVGRPAESGSLAVAIGLGIED